MNNEMPPPDRDRDRAPDLLARLQQQHPNLNLHTEADRAALVRQQLRALGLGLDPDRLRRPPHEAPEPGRERSELSEKSPLNSHNSLNSQPGSPHNAGAHPSSPMMGLTGARPWPEAPGPAAYRGLAGKVVQAVRLQTEGDDVGVLASFLTMFGNAVGSGPHFFVGATRHTARLYAVLVGRSAKGRKGEATAPPEALMAAADPAWRERILGGLSSGEGLIWAVRDPIEREEPVKQRGIITGYQTVRVDGGVADKRLLVYEREFARVLAVLSRQGNILSSVLRDAWDSGALNNMTKNQPAQATGAHISLLCHVTAEELRQELPDITAANGFANRFLWFCVKRAREIPSPKPFTGERLADLAADIRERLEEASCIGIMRRNAEAEARWAALYHDLSAEREGLAGAILGRAEAHVVRLSML
jgi:hypothetical protein